MKRASLLAIAVVLCQVMFVKLHVLEHKRNDTDTCILKLEENAKRVRSEVIKELTDGITEKFKNQFREHELLKKEIAVERSRQRVIEEKVDMSYERVQKLEAALSQCTSITVPNTTASTTTTTTAEPNLCAAGFVKFEDHCYILELDEVSWGAAEDRCRGLGADLVSINSRAENDFLMEKIKEYYPPGEEKVGNFWIGMMYKGGRYVWTDGTRVGFTDWRSADEPNCMDHVCSALISTYESFYKWEDAMGSLNFHYICEKYAV